jgi:hypothetical protein
MTVAVSNQRWRAASVAIWAAIARAAAAMAPLVSSLGS